MDTTRYTDWVRRFDQEMAKGKVAAALITSMYGLDLAPPAQAHGPPAGRALTNKAMERGQEGRRGHRHRASARPNPALRGAAARRDGRDHRCLRRGAAEILLLAGDMKQPAFIKPAFDAFAGPSRTTGASDSRPGPRWLGRRQHSSRHGKPEIVAQQSGLSSPSHELQSPDRLLRHAEASQERLMPQESPADANAGPSEPAAAPATVGQRPGLVAVDHHDVKAGTGRNRAAIGATRPRRRDRGVGTVAIAISTDLAMSAAKAVAAALAGGRALRRDAAPRSPTPATSCCSQEVYGQPPATDASHPFGYGAELFYWALLAALSIFVVGGVLSIWEGISACSTPKSKRVLWALPCSASAFCSTAPPG